MEIRAVDVFELLTYITTTLNLLFTNKFFTILNIDVVIVFGILVMCQINKDNTENKGEE